MRSRYGEASDTADDGDERTPAAARCSPTGNALNRNDFRLMCANERLYEAYAELHGLAQGGHAAGADQELSRKLLLLGSGPAEPTTAGTSKWLPLKAEAWRENMHNPYVQLMFLFTRLDSSCSSLFGATLPAKSPPVVALAAAAHQVDSLFCCLQTLRSLSTVQLFWWWATRQTASQHL